VLAIVLMTNMASHGMARAVAGGRILLERKWTERTSPRPSPPTRLSHWFVNLALMMCTALHGMFGRSSHPHLHNFEELRYIVICEQRP